ncbi:hypothetical protein SORBI_3003G044500 [Sorghum bicolor]|uniref:Uncharacterized protein n=1 Tax=Sorghum bicolor TaxID=4558 RepID=A0A1W0VVN9_SORBI|nr:hypothetical protein SORBI_3K004400 [Sorghum bicolor]OQU86209.1 hypothetical protein SORBI_3003G044500 [Sorghum bicolor]
MSRPAEMRNPRHADDGDLQLAWIGRRRRGLQQQLLLDSGGRACMLLGALVLTWDQLALASSSSPEHVLLAAFVLWLLGAALVMLSLVSRRFPRLASAGAALVMALRNYLLGGGGL